MPTRYRPLRAFTSTDYTKYNRDYQTTTNDVIGIDIRNDMALAYGEGTVTEFGTEYKYYCGASLDIEMPREF